MKSRPIVTAFTAAFALAGAAQATQIERGRAGLQEVALTVRNGGQIAIACGATLAHWYAQPIGTAEPGATVTSSLWLNRGTGEVFLLNPSEDRMPVERLWCGRKGQSWATREEIPLARRAGQALPPIHLTCAVTADAVRCFKG